jgi:hypothetical protein
MTLISASVLSSIKILGFHLISSFFIFSLITFNQTVISDVFALLVIISIIRMSFENESNINRVCK